MKHNIDQLLSAYIFDNKDFIKQSGFTTIAECILEETESLDGGFNWFLSDEESRHFEYESEFRDQAIKEITEYINENYNYSVEDF